MLKTSRLSNCNLQNLRGKAYEPALLLYNMVFSELVDFHRIANVIRRTEISFRKWKHTKNATIIPLNPSLYSCELIIEFIALLHDSLQDFGSVLLLFEGNMLYFIPVLVVKDCKYRETFGPLKPNLVRLSRMKFARAIASRNCTKYNPFIILSILVYSKHFCCSLS